VPPPLPASKEKGLSARYLHVVPQHPNHGNANQVDADNTQTVVKDCFLLIDCPW